MVSLIRQWLTHFWVSHSTFGMIYLRLLDNRSTAHCPQLLLLLKGIDIRK